MLIFMSLVVFTAVALVAIGCLIGEEISQRINRKLAQRHKE